MASLSRLARALRYRLAERRWRQMVESSPLFDAAWYRSRYSDVATGNLDAAVHYLRHGGHEGRDPGPLFSSHQYLELHPDVRRLGMNPLVHYLLHGRAEGRAAPVALDLPELKRIVEGSAFFDAEWYLSQYKDVAASGIDPVVHYLSQGWREGRDPGPLFSSRLYVERNPDVGRWDLNPLLHCLMSAHVQWRPGPETLDVAHLRRIVASSSFFDERWYSAQYPDIARSGTDGAVHYLSQGWREGRDPGPRFSSSRYLERNPDVRSSGINPLVHYLLFGRAEGRLGPESVEIAYLHRAMDELMARIERQLARIELTEKAADAHAQPASGTERVPG